MKDPINLFCPIPLIILLCQEVSAQIPQNIDVGSGDETEVLWDSPTNIGLAALLFAFIVAYYMYRRRKARGE